MSKKKKIKIISAKLDFDCLVSLMQGHSYTLIDVEPGVSLDLSLEKCDQQENLGDALDEISRYWDEEL